MKTFLFLRKKSKGLSGFTLIELLVVIAIIGVLASIVLASLNNARRKSRDARRITDVKQIQLALELYFDGTGANSYPVPSATCSAAAQYGLEALKTGGYIPQMPRDPLANAAGTNGCYAYAAAAASPTSYHLGASLEDITNSALGGDPDKVDAGWTNAFNGTSAAVAPAPCNATAGVAYGQASNTETCYDTQP